MFCQSRMLPARPWLFSAAFLDQALKLLTRWESYQTSARFPVEFPGKTSLLKHILENQEGVRAKLKWLIDTDRYKHVLQSKCSQ